MPNFYLVIMTTTHQYISILFIVQIRNQFCVCRYCFYLLFSPDVENVNHIVFTSDSKFITIWMETTTQNRICSLKFVDTLTCSQIPQHSKTSQIAGKDNRAIGVEIQRMDFFEVTFLVEKLFEFLSIPHAPSMVIGGCKKSQSVMMELCLVYAISMPSDLHAFLLLSTWVQTPNKNFPFG